MKFRKKFFWSGAILFFGGIFGFVNFFWQKSISLDRVFSQKSAFFAEIFLNKNISFEKNFPQFNFLDQFFGQNSEFNLQNFTDFCGENFGFSIFENGEIAVAAEIKNQKKLFEFLEKLKLPRENFSIKKEKNFEIWTPEFSSPLAIGFFKKWVFFATDEKILRENFESKNKIFLSENYQKIRRDAPKKLFFFSFLNSEKIANLGGKKLAATQKSLFSAAAKILPAAGFWAKIKNDGVELDAKILAAENFATKNAAAQVLPQLAKFAQKNQLFFANGENLYSKYKNTKKFLENLHPQFALIFDGILRAASRDFFGEKFNFETDFLQKMHGQYSILADFENAEFPFLHFSLITNFGSHDRAENLKNLQKIIELSQQNFSTKIEKVALPDGTFREELVAAKGKKNSIIKKKFKNFEYFSAENPQSQKNFSFAFLENFLVFSTHERGILSAIAAFSSGENLMQNQDFRQSILFDFPPAENYGFLNLAKLHEISENFAAENSQNFFTFLRQNFRNFVFARKNLPTEIFWSAKFFWR